MGQIISLDIRSASYPDNADALDFAETVLLRAVRSWMADWRLGNDPMAGLAAAMQAAGVRDAAFSIDQVMAVLARTAREPVAIHCPHCPGLSHHEKCLLHAASLAQAGASELAERTLRTALLSATGAEFCLGPLEGLARLFAQARLYFRRRQLAEAQLSDGGFCVPPE
jgi:hypothetical protein